MKNTDKDLKVTREFKLTTLALKNKNTVFLITIITILFGLYSYRSLPKELFPDIVLPTILVQTIYPGNPPVDIENLITRPLEKEIDGVKGLNKLTSTSSQDASLIFVEFNTDVLIEDALQEVKDAVDKAKAKLPNDLLDDPMVMDIDFSEFPILNINLSGEYSINELKAYAEYLEEEIEGVSEISKVEIKGINEREIKINVDQHKMEALELNFGDIEKAIASENISISGGEIKVNETRMSVRTIGEFKSVDEIRDVIVKHENNKIVYLRDIAEVVDGYEDPKSFARLDGESVVSLQVIKKGGENLLAATDQIFDILEEAHETGAIPDDLTVTLSNDQSDMIRMQLSNLENSMIMGMIFVILVLFYFLGTRNALFVGLAIPMSMLISFVVMGMVGTRINMIVLFALILALGMLVDNAIVVVENIYRFVDKGFPVWKAAKNAVGEIAMPIISSTATTLAAFLPLAFWSGMVGEFMSYLPWTLIIVLTSSLFVALVIIPVFASVFIRPEEPDRKPNKKKVLKIIAALLVLAVIFYIVDIRVLANLLIIISAITLLNIYFFGPMGKWFQYKGLKKLEDFYLRVLKFSLRAYNPHFIIGGTIVLMVITLVFFFIVRKPDVDFFPNNDPQYINIIAELPIGTDITATDKMMKGLESDIDKMLEPYKSITKTVLTTVGEGAVSENEISTGATPNRGLITITFEDFELREGINTSFILADISNQLIGNYPDIQFIIDKNRMAPPTGKPINIEISGKDFDKLLAITDEMQFFIEGSGVEGMEGLKIDLEVGKPELIISIDRDKARMFGLSTSSVASTIRTALYGKEISDFKVGEDEYPIQLRLKEDYRNNLSSLMNQKVTFRDAATGKIKQVPISSVAGVTHSTTYGAVKRNDLKRVITLYSNVLEGYNANEINIELKALLNEFPMPAGYTYDFTGEQEEQQESMDFLIRAMFMAIAIILLILVSQFNSIIKPLIIISSVVLSTIGVFGGLATFNMDFVVIMTGIGIVSLAGVVVNNAIVLIDYIDLLKRRRRKEIGLDSDAPLSVQESMECIQEAGKTRLRPVLLTAITTILGLITMAVGMNINFATLLTDFKPDIYFGGDMVAFWGPMAWTVIFGLTFATFLTLVVVPCMYHVLYLGKLKFFVKKK